MDLVKQIISKKNEMNLSRVKFARYIGVSIRTIERLENGERVASKTLKKIVESLDLDVDYHEYADIQVKKIQFLSWNGGKSTRVYIYEEWIEYLRISKEYPKVDLFFYEDEIWIKKHREKYIEDVNLIDKVTKTIFFSNTLKLTIPINWLREMNISEKESYVSLNLCKDKIILKKANKVLK
ncbi:helix-turn-helix transcriptional regulator [Clostridioides difficile]|nr:helix-turn-helix transcriptional regulator [Clostridioides difficile]